MEEGGQGEKREARIGAEGQLTCRPRRALQDVHEQEQEGEVHRRPLLQREPRYRDEKVSSGSKPV